MADIAASGFLSTPSAGRATFQCQADGQARHISIHALRGEGDSVQTRKAPGTSYFYPRPPRGGRRRSERPRSSGSRFLSTPSAGRATNHADPLRHRRHYFYPRPPRGGRQVGLGVRTPRIVISIHALRGEGDERASRPRCGCPNFYPRPPRGGRQSPIPELAKWALIFLSTPSAGRATLSPNNSYLSLFYFYPRPPRGGRLSILPQNGQS